MIAASQITQYAATIQTAVQRMIISGIAPYSICYGSNVAGHSPSVCSAPAQYRVFDPDGGGVVYQCAPEDQIDPGNWGSTIGWYRKFRGIRHDSDKGMYVKDVGTNTDASGRDAIMGAIALKLAICQQINKGLGLDQTPAAVSNFTWDAQSTTYAVGTNVIDSNPGEPFACADFGGSYGYYHTLIER